METTQEMVQLMDDKIKQRRDAFLVDIVSEAAMKAELQGDTKIYDVDRFVR